MPNIAAEIVYTMLNDDWLTENVSKPKLVARETAEKLREKIPRNGALLIYAESGGIRITPRGNRVYKDELANVTIEVHTLTSENHWFQLVEEVVRIIEENTRTVSPFQVIRPLGHSQEYGTTFRYWKGNIRCELSRVGVRTGYAGPSSLAT